MSIRDQSELIALQRAGQVVAETIRTVSRMVRAGVTTRELDRAAARVFARHGARSGPQLDYGFPGTICISVDAEAVHGIPGPRRLRDGQLVKIDVTAELDGFYADACRTVAVGQAPPRARKLVAATEAALRDGIAAAVAGAPVHAIGTAVERRAAAHGFAVCADLTGHGIGRRIHEPPTVPSVFDPSASERLAPGLVLTVEPIVAAGEGEVVGLADGWTVVTADGSRTAHAEHTIVVTEAQPLVLTR
jgi:methionyl aminopeptidase